MDVSFDSFFAHLYWNMILVCIVEYSNIIRMVSQQQAEMKINGSTHQPTIDACLLSSK